MALTVEGIRTAKPKPGKTGDRWLSEKTGVRNVGRLLVRISRASGTRRFYFRYNLPGDQKVLIPLGVYSPDKRGGALTLDQARAEAAKLSDLYAKSDSRDVRAYLAAVERERAASLQAEAQQLEAERRAALDEAAAVERYSVQALADVYVKHLTRRGKVRSAKDVANIFKNHLHSNPLATRPARAITAKEVTALLRSVVEAGKGRTAGKLRSYLRAAYALAITADLDPTAASEFIGFDLSSNPVAPVGALKEFSRARDRTLTEAELAAYWSRLASVKADAVRGALQLALLLGGQRPTQLVRLQREQVDLTAGWITLHDPKGARKQARTHELPLTLEARRVLTPLVDRAEALNSQWVFTSEGKAAIYPDTLTAEARRIAQAMKVKREAREEFRLSDLRRTAETMMAAMGISRDTRAQIQSHGLGGVQQRHYDKHDYRAEKLKALTAWSRRLTAGPTPASVVSINAKRKQRA